MTRYPLLVAALGLALAPALPAFAQSEPPDVPQYCMYPYDGSICTPTVRGTLQYVGSKLPTVTEYCFYPYDGAICIPWVEQ